MINPDAIQHVTGRSVYLDDIPVLRDTLFGAVFASPVAHGRIVSFDCGMALQQPGVVAVFSARDVPGENQIGGIIPDEPLFADGEVHFCGQPIAFVVAHDEHTARKALKHIRVEIAEMEVITDPREACRRGMLLIPPRTFRSGNIDAAWLQCAHIFEGTTESGGQEHLYIETQGAYACPTENNGIKIHSSTQGPTLVQHTTAVVLGIPMHRVEVDVARLGGGFGGKEDQATAWACMVALAAYKLQKPVKMCLHRLDDMQMTGKRHPYSADFRIGLTNDLKIIAYQAIMYQNGGAAADLSPAILDRSLFHATNCYHIANTEILAYSCKTNLPPNTAFRGFGGPQAMFIMESAIAKAAHELGLPAIEIQQRNLLSEGDVFHYGQTARHVNIGTCLQEASSRFDLPNLIKRVNEFNAANTEMKKGLALMPICFGISFTNKRMNQAHSLVHVYHDGSIGVSTGAVEMGQGVNAKIRQVAAAVFSVDASRIKLETTNTSRVANTSPTAASSGADLNGKATQIACNAILARLKALAAEALKANEQEIEVREEWVWKNKQITHMHWEQLVELAVGERVSLSETGHYATPYIDFDKEAAKGHPFAYHVYGVAILETTVDCIRGIYHFDRALIVHDFGNSINPLIDLGQVEGGLVQGIGWMTMEEVVYNEKGRLLSDSLSTYKVPDIYAVPEDVQCIPLDTNGPELAIMRSKAVGEPPFMYGIGAFFALQNAIKAFNPDYVPDFDAPLTPEKVLMRLFGVQEE